jgi:hypothetical protein
MNVEVKVSGFRDIDGEAKMMKDLYLVQATSILKLSPKSPKPRVGLTQTTLKLSPLR